MFNRIAYVVRMSDGEHSLILINDERFSARKLRMDGSIDLPVIDFEKDADEYVRAAWDVILAMGEPEGTVDLDYRTAAVMYNGGEDNEYYVLSYMALWFDVVEPNAVTPRCGAYDRRYVHGYARKRSDKAFIEVFLEDADQTQMIGQEERNDAGRWVRYGEWARMYREAVR